MKTTKSEENVMESSTNGQRSHQSVSPQASAPAVVTYSGHQKRSLYAQHRSSSQSSIIYDRDSHFVNLNNNNDFDHIIAQKQSSSPKYSTMAKRAAFASRTSSRSSVLSSQPTLLLNDSDYLINSSRCSTPTSSLAVADSTVESGSVTNSWVNKQQRNNNFQVLQHLQKHASTFGLDVSSLEPNNMHYQNQDIIPNEMSQQGDSTSLHQSAAFLSWRKLHLSKAKLKAASNTSALLAGFAMVAVVEIQLNEGQVGKLPVPLLILFAICTTLLVAVHMLALLISTCILPNMEAISNLHSLSLVHESPHEKMQIYIELAWGCSTVLGILLFMVEVTILCWIQFYNVLMAAAYVSTCILVPFVILFIWFAFIFYRKLVAHTYEVRKSGIQELEMLKHGLEMGDVELGGPRQKLRGDSMENIV